MTKVSSKCITKEWALTDNNMCVEEDLILFCRYQVIYDVFESKFLCLDY